MHKILVPVDGSIHAMKALQIACDLAEKYGGRIALIHILSEGKLAAELLDLAAASAFGPQLRQTLRSAVDKDLGPAPTSILQAVGERILKQAAEKVIHRGVEVDVLAIEQGEPVEYILLARKQVDASTIVMGCRGENDSGQSSFGSVSNAVFQQAPCTCLSVK